MRIEITGDDEYAGRVVLDITDDGVRVHLHPAKAAPAPLLDATEALRSGGRITATSGGGQGAASSAASGTNAVGGEQFSCAQCGRTDYPHVHRSGGGGTVTYMGPTDLRGPFAPGVQT